MASSKHSHDATTATTTTTTATATKKTKSKKSVDHQILSAAKSIQEMCASGSTGRSNEEDGTAQLASPSLSLMRLLMDSLRQCVTQARTEGEMDAQLLSSILADTMKIGSLVKRMNKLHACILFMERPTVLNDLATTAGDLSLSLIELSANTILIKLWNQQQARLEHLIEQARFEKAHILNATTTYEMPPALQACLVTDEARQELVRVLQRHKRKLFQKATNTTKDASTRTMACQNLEYLDKFLNKLADLYSGDDGETAADAAAATLQMDMSCQTTAFDTSLTSLGASSHHSTGTSGSTTVTTTTTIPSWAFCPVSKALMTEPVKVRAECNHSLSKQVFQEWIALHNKTCPVCGCKLIKLAAKRNTELQLQIQQKVHEVEQERLRLARENEQQTTAAAAAMPTFGMASKTPLVGDSGELSIDDLVVTTQNNNNEQNKGNVTTTEAQRSQRSYENMLVAFQNSHGSLDSASLHISSLASGNQQQQQPGDSVSTIDHGESHQELDNSMSLAETFGIDQSLHSRTEGEPQQQSKSQQPVVITSTGSLDDLFKHDVLQRQVTTDTQATEIVDNRAITSSVSHTHKTIGSKKNKKKQAVVAQEGDNNASAVSFAPILVTNFIEFEEQHEDSSSNTGDDDSSFVVSGDIDNTSNHASTTQNDGKTSKANKKNPVKKFFSRLTGSSSNKKEPAKQAQVPVPSTSTPSKAAAATKKQAMDSSQTTTMTADLSNTSISAASLQDDSHRRYNNNTNNKKSTVQQPLNSRGVTTVKASSSRAPPSKSILKKDGSDPPPLMTMQN